MAFGDADLAVFTGDVFKVAVAYGYQRATGVLDRADALTPDGQGSSLGIRTTVLTIATRDLTGLQDGAAITVAGRAYQIRQVDLADDGKLSMVHLAEV